MLHRNPQRTSRSATPATPNAYASSSTLHGTARQEFFGDGIPVAIGQIPRELKKVWQEGQKTAMRASRLNLVIYSAAEHSIRANTERGRQNHPAATRCGRS